MDNPGQTFRELLRTEPYLFTGGVYSPLDAQIAERVGMKSIYLSGYSMAMANGWPDMGFLTQTEVARIGAMVASAVEIPVIADADDGYGNALSTIRTVQEYVRSGVAGIHIEDQVFPKRCGHIAGKTSFRSIRPSASTGRPSILATAESRLRHHRPHRRLRGRGRQLEETIAAAGLRGCRRGPRVAGAVECRPRDGRRLRQGDARVSSEYGRWPSILVSSVAQGPNPFTFAEWASSTTSSSSSRSSPPHAGCTRYGTRWRSW